MDRAKKLKTRIPCNECNVGFDQPELLLIHMESHKTENTDERFYEEESLDNCDGSTKKCPACAESKYKF